MANDHKRFSAEDLQISLSEALPRNFVARSRVWALQRIGDYRGMRREVARQAEFPAKGLAGNFFVARHLAIISCNSEKVPRHAIDPIGQPPNPAADGWRFAIALQSATGGPTPCDETGDQKTGDSISAIGPKG